MQAVLLGLCESSFLLLEYSVDPYVLCIVHCNKVSKPVKGNYLLLCMNSIMYLLPT